MRVPHAPGLPGTFSPPPRVTDPGMQHSTSVAHVPWCMSGSLTVAVKTFPAFPAHTHPNFTYMIRGPWHLTGHHWVISHTPLYKYFLHDWTWISPWIKSISNELDIIIHVIVSGHCDVISNRLWRHQQNENRASETRGRFVKIVVLSSFMDSLCRVRNKAMRDELFLPSFECYFCVYFPLVSVETVRHSSTYIILYTLAEIIMKPPSLKNISFDSHC